MTANNPSVELLPCPFCGGSDVGLNSQSIYITCRTCDADGPWNELSEEEEAIAAWNRRALTEPAGGEVERVARVARVARAMTELCSPPKGASFEQACEWVPPTIEDMARAAIAAMREPTP